MEQLEAIFRYEFLGIEVQNYVLAFLCILGGLLFRKISILICMRLSKAAKHTRTTIDDILVASLSKPISAMAVVVGLWLAITLLPLPTEPFDFPKLVSALLKAATVAVVVWALMRIVDGAAERARERAVDSHSTMAGFIPVAKNSIKTFLILVGIVVVLQNLGYSITSLLAGLGIGGLAIGLAAKDTLANLFGSLVIFIDRPFIVGDWIVVGDEEGVVEEVGLRVTRIRTFANSLITIPNSQLTTTAITNWSKMGKRRIKTTIGVTYDTPPEKIEAAVQVIRRIIQEDDRIRNDFYLVNFNNFGAYSLDIFVYCFTVTTVWAEYMQVQQEFYMKIMQEFGKLGVEFAFPTQTLHVEGMNPLKVQGSPTAQ